MWHEINPTFANKLCKGDDYKEILEEYGIWGIFFMLSWMFQHGCLDTYCFECLICMCFVFLYLHLFSAIDMFYMERHSRNTLIIVIIIIIWII